MSLDGRLLTCLRKHKSGPKKGKCAKYGVTPKKRRGKAKATRKAAAGKKVIVPASVAKRKSGPNKGRLKPGCTYSGAPKGKAKCLASVVGKATKKKAAKKATKKRSGKSTAKRKSPAKKASKRAARKVVGATVSIDRCKVVKAGGKGLIKGCRPGKKGSGKALCTQAIVDARKNRSCSGGGSNADVAKAMRESMGRGSYTAAMEKAAVAKAMRESMGRGQYSLNGTRGRTSSSGRRRR